MFGIMGQSTLFDTWFQTNDRAIEDRVDVLGRLPVRY